MKQYILTLIAVALLNAVFGMLSPDGEIKKYVRLVGALCLLLALTQPILGWVGEGQELWGDIFGEQESQPDYEEIYGQAILSGGRQNLEAILRDELVKELGIPDNSIDVWVALAVENGEGRIEQVRLTLRGAAITVDPRVLTEYINQRLYCPCTVIYD